MSIRKIPILLFVILITVVGLVGPTTALAKHGSVHAHDLLLQIAERNPQAPVAVIVQKAEQGNSVESLAVELGGKITKQLSIINAFAAEMTASAAVELAYFPAVRWVSLDAPVFESTTGERRFITWATEFGGQPASGYSDSANMLSPYGPDQRFAYASKGQASFSGLMPEFTPDTSVRRVEAVLRLYASAGLAKSEAPTVSLLVNGELVATDVINVAQIKPNQAAKAETTVYVDLTGGRAWTWEDLTQLEVVLDQGQLSPKHRLYIDAVGVRVTVSNGFDETMPITMPSPEQIAAEQSAVGQELSPDVPQLAIGAITTNTFTTTTRATSIWNEGYKGSGITVAVVDSGSFRYNGIGSRLTGIINFNSSDTVSSDQYGHGTFVTGLIADGGSVSYGKYMGVAPMVNIIGMRVTDDYGRASEADVVEALQWVYYYHENYNIRVVNLSLNSAMMQDYKSSPLDAAVEVLWFNGITVVASAGNNGTASLYPPANDPFVITVGATNENGTTSLSDDVVASFSAYGTTSNGVAKPDLVAPGTNLIAYLPSSAYLTISVDHPTNRVDSYYFRMSGTSMSAPLVTGTAAIMLQYDPDLTPDQVKNRLKITANKSWAGYTAQKAGAGCLDVYAAVKSTSTASANTGYAASTLLTTGDAPLVWGSVAWNSVAWNSVAWNSVAWNSVAWNSVAWNSDYWGR